MQVPRGHEAIAPVVAGAYQDDHRHANKMPKVTPDALGHDEARVLHERVFRHAHHLGTVFYAAHLVCGYDFHLALGD
jgi:hypothetical protein